MDSERPSAEVIVSDQPVVTDHDFYLWDDTDAITRAICGICGDAPAAHSIQTSAGEAQP